MLENLKTIIDNFLSYLASQPASFIFLIAKFIGIAIIFFLLKKWITAKGMVSSLRAFILGGFLVGVIVYLYFTGIIPSDWLITLKNGLISAGHWLIGGLT